VTRALVVTLPEKGHYHPLLGPAEALAARGVEVAFAALYDIRKELAAAGVRRVLLPPGAPPPSDEIRGERLAAMLRDPALLRGWIREMLVEAPRRSVAEMRGLIRELRPNVLAIDTMAYDAAIAAELEGIPWVGWSTSLNPAVPDEFDSELIRTLRALDPQRQQLFSEHGVSARFRVSDVLSPRGTACFSTEALVGVAKPGVELVGPSLGGRRQGDAIDWELAGERPLVYASFGSQAWHQPHRFDLLIEAASRAEVALLVAMGDLAEPYRGRGLPSWCRCVSFAPQLDALAKARVLVTHGGANSVMEALAHGVPLLVSPLCNDQPHNLSFVEKAGAGLGVDLDHCSVGELASTLRCLSSDGPERAAARRIAASYGERSGAEGAANLALRAAG
jgi:zeaxanthin glucosyltransferase